MIVFHLFTPKNVNIIKVLISDSVVSSNPAQAGCTRYNIMW